MPSVGGSAEVAGVAVDQAAAARVMAQLGIPGGGPARWSHLPGRGRGPVQPHVGRLLKVGLVKLVKPVVIVGFFLAALWLCWQVFPPLLGFDGLVPDAPTVEQPATAGDPPPAEPAPVPTP